MHFSDIVSELRSHNSIDDRVEHIRRVFRLQVGSQQCALQTDAIVDTVQEQLKSVESGAELDKKVADTLKKRKLISPMYAPRLVCFFYALYVASQGPSAADSACCGAH